MFAHAGNNMDIVYLVKECKDNPELTYSMRSLANLPHNRVFMVGGCPDNINKAKITHITALQRNNKYKNTTNNLQLACQHKELSEDFILMNDDFFVIKPIKDPVAELNLCRGSMDKVINDYKRRFHNECSSYLQGMQQTKIFLQDIGIANPLSYELHIPMVINKQKFLEMFKLPYINSIQVLHKRSLYGNLYLKNSPAINDVKVLVDYFYPLGTDKFLSTEDNSFQRCKSFLNNLFPEKCEYEK